MTCIERGLFREYRCRRYTSNEIKSIYYNLIDNKQNELDKNVKQKDTAVKLSRVAQRRLEAERRKRLRRSRKQSAVIDEKEYLKNLHNKLTDEKVVFEDDGYKHTYCPVSDLMDQVLMTIFEDTMYCIETNSLPTSGGALDQTQVFKVAFMALKSEREVIRAEKERKAIEDAKRQQQAEQAKHSLVKRR